MKRSLNPREKRLLLLCLSTIFIAVNVLAFREFTIRKKALSTSLEQLNEQVTSNRVWLNDRAFWDKRRGWLDKNMPYTESAGKAQGQLLEDLQNAALDSELTISNQTLLEPLELDHCNEVAVSIRMRGDQETMLRLLLSLQSPERFQAIKSLELELDSRAKEKTPQAQCNLTVARWFNPLPPSGDNVSPAPVAPAAPVEIEPVNPLEVTTPLENLVPAETSTS
jgi:Tfp pilus assembly protein PilO